MSKVAAAVIALLALGACTAESPTSLRPAPDAARSITAAASRTVVMSGLDSPRGLAWGPEGGLYVAEAGSSVAPGPCFATPRGPSCYSGTGAITRLWHGRQERVASGLPSAYGTTTTDIGGPHDISFLGRGNAQVVIGWGGPPQSRAAFGAFGAAFGSLIALEPSGGWRVVADIAAFEGAVNPAGGVVESNPYGVLAEADARYVVDAGGNSLLAVRPNGDVSLVATFAAIPVPRGPFNPPFAQSDAVPTEVTRGPDGALYVSTLTGVPFLPGAAAIYRVVPGQAPQVYAGGLTQITDFDWAPDGSLLVAQYASGPFFAGPGSVVRVAPDGSRSTVAAGLSHPTGVLAGPDGSVYVSNNGNLPGVGEVLRFVP
jgi:glucose/arabinose dehydrogenase